MGSTIDKSAKGSADGAAASSPPQNAGWTLRPIGLALGGAGLVTAVALVAIGLPSGPVLFGSPLASLTVPAAVLAMVTGLWLAGWTSTTRPRWRVVDVVVASVLGVLGAAIFVVWNVSWAPLSAAVAGFPPASALGVGVWLLPAVLGGLIVRRPGAAVYTETVAAVISALVGNQWGFSTVWYGFLEGMGAEVVFALLLFRRWGLPTALAAGAGAGVVVGLLDTFVYYPDFELGYKLLYLAFAILSGVVVAGLGAWGLTRALAATGALAPLASGRDAPRV